MTVDVVNGTGQPSVSTDVTSRLTSGGVTVGGVTATTGPVTSSIQYSAEGTAQAKQLADALGAGSYLQEVAVAHVTLVLGPDDDGRLLAAVDTFTGVPASACGAFGTPTR
jgi:hypothetical protein